MVNPLVKEKGKFSKTSSHVDLVFTNSSELIVLEDAIQLDKDSTPWMSVKEILKDENKMKLNILAKVVKIDSFRMLRNNY